MGGPAADFGGVFKAHIWQQPAHRLAQPPELDTMSKFHFGQAPPPVINHLCVIAHTLLAPVCVWPTFGNCAAGEISILLQSKSRWKDDIRTDVTRKIGTIAGTMLVCCF